MSRTAPAQDLPYGTMGDSEMRKLDIGTLQDDGVIFVWVTGAVRFVLMQHQAKPLNYSALLVRVRVRVRVWEKVLRS